MAVQPCMERIPIKKKKKKKKKKPKQLGKIIFDQDLENSMVKNFQAIYIHILNNETEAYYRLGKSQNHKIV